MCASLLLLLPPPKLVLLRTCAQPSADVIHLTRLQLRVREQLHEVR
jgi:hypothetical protein